MELWEGRTEYAIEGRVFRATEVSIAHDRSFKLRAKRGPWGKGGSLAELSQLLALGGMSTAEIAQIYRFQLLSQSLAAAEVQPLAGMLVQGPGQRGRKGPSPKTYVAVGASTGTLQQKELEWVLSSPSTASCEQTLASFRESEAMEGVHLTLISDDVKLRETFAAVELTADTFVPRGKIAKQRRALRERDHAGRSSFRVQIKSRSSMSTGRFSRKEMEALCGEGREESWVHIQLACKEFELMIALAHNRVMETIKGCLTESWKKKSVEQESWWQTPINSMTGLGLTAPEHGNLIPDGLCYFRGSNRIVLVEIARTSEFTGEGSSLANLKAKFQEKEQKYAALRAEMTSRSDNTEVIQATFIAGVRGSIMEREWTTNFRNLLMDEDMIDRAMTKIVIQLLEVQHMLWTSRRRGDTTNREQA
ncbi:hypothetical protein GUITHDRAFT_116523 [Guillardia theta CCMP2712]|uniref:Uncharacterized protein n=1 Tax=Guillardia theta (strain CCMP2712) TaxID=905079 RepID=L1IND3_GUITC|nr:hypothetical protein GUITHDRAFT_116523 [Guillardia theta CCMP2712]EKX37409.1 hypothetical protein GUITHDRAFT_116523 [Guillardia theta CCMP2712]|eukprot:XP_005824389.1 hypothetical protein GUITHDRAFT_116523 [Guillardia theta CCMP2712]